MSKNGNKKFKPTLRKTGSVYSSNIDEFVSESYLKGSGKLIISMEISYFFFYGSLKKRWNEMLKDVLNNNLKKGKVHVDADFSG